MHASQRFHSSTRKRAVNTLVLKAIAVCALMLPTTVAHAQYAIANWTSQTTGTVAGVDFTVTGFNPFWDELNTIDLTGSDFSAGEFANATVAEYSASDNWTVTFAAPVTGLRVYAGFWRGIYTLVDDNFPSRYIFSEPFSIASGFTGLAPDGNELLVPADDFYSGILQFDGTFTQLSVASGSPTNAAQFLTFALQETSVVPEPSVVLLLACGMLPLVGFARRRRAVELPLAARPLFSGPPTESPLAPPLDITSSRASVRGALLRNER